MSAIASFYLLPKGDLPRLVELAKQPPGPARGGKWHDPFWEFLSGSGRQLEAYPWSGYVMGSEVYFFLESRAAAWEDYSDGTLSDSLSEARGGTFFVFRAEGAEAVSPGD